MKVIGLLLLAFGGLLMYSAYLGKSVKDILNLPQRSS